MGKRNAFISDWVPVDPRGKQHGSRESGHGFTLVELLVVIGIIAVLTGILMPALSRARQSANSTKCMANLRSIGEIMQLYTNQWNGTFPEGLGPDGLDDWRSLLAVNVGWTNQSHFANMGTADTNGNLNTFLCPDGKPFTPTPESHYSCHPLLMPDMTQNYPGKFPDVALQKQQRIPYHVNTVPNPSDIVLIFDGAQAMGGDGSANALGNNIDCNRISGDNLTPTNPGVTYLIAGYNNVNLYESIDGGLNLDGPPTTNNRNIRWRHLGNRSANFLFVDGHVESKRYNSELQTDVTRENVYVPTP